ncbi:MAG: hypothetical protein AB7S72_08905 [Draconibacterium sp.]
MRKREEIERKSEDRSRKTEDRSLKSEKMLSDRDNSLSDRDNTLSDSREIQSGWVGTLSVSQKTLSGRLAGQSVFKINATGRVNSLSGRVKPQSGKGFNFLFLISYFLFSGNKEHRIRNNKSGSLGTAPSGRHISARGNALVRRTPKIPAPSFNAPALAPGNIAVPFMGRTWNTTSTTGLQPYEVFNFLFLISYSLFPENKKHRIRNNKSGSLRRALKGQHISARGNAPVRRTPKIPAPPFNAPALATEQLINAPKFRGRLTISDCRTTASSQPHEVFNFLFLISYFLFSGNKEHRIRNNKSGSLRRALKGQHISAQGNAPGKQAPVTPAPLFSAPVYNFLFLISYFLFPENKEHRITNTESGILGTPQRGEISITPGFNPGMSAPTTSCPSFNAPALATEQLINAPKFRGRLTIDDCRTTASSQPHEVFNFLFLISYFLFSGNKKHRIRNNKSGSLRRALKGQHISAQGNALVRRTPKIPAPSFNAPALATEQLINAPKFRGRLTISDCRTTASSQPHEVFNFLFLISYFLFSGNKKHRIRNNKSGSLGTPQRGEISITPGFNPGMSAPTTSCPSFSAPALATEQLINAPKFRGRLTISDCRTTASSQPHEVFNFLFLISYFLFSGNKKHRIRNNKSGSLGTPQRGEISITPGFNPGMSAPTTSCPSFSAPALATEQLINAPKFRGRLTISDCRTTASSQPHEVFNFLFLISYFLFSGNKKHRIGNNKSGSLGTPQRGEISITPGFNPGMSAPTTSCPSFNAPALAPDFRLTNNECKKNDIKNIPDFPLRGSRYFGIGGLLIPTSNFTRLLRQGEGPVVHNRAQAVRACLLPLFSTLTTNASAFFVVRFFNN